MPPNFDVSLDYAAGIIDGEGTIGFSYDKGKDALSINIRVSMTTPIIPELLHSKFGGFLVKWKEKRANRRDLTTWAIKSIKAKDFLLLITPHLILKRNQAMLALYYEGVKHSLNHETKMILKNQMHELNKRGTDMNVESEDE